MKRINRHKLLALTLTVGMSGVLVCCNQADRAKQEPAPAAVERVGDKAGGAVEPGTIHDPLPLDAPYRDVKIVGGERFGDMYFTHYGTNPTVDVAEQPRSSFAIDVDTASYSVVRAHLDRRAMPPEAAVRVEEFINAFDYAYEGPAAGAERPFNVHAEVFPSPHRSGYHVLHLGVKGREVARAERKPANLVFVIDVSGSMQGDNRLGLVKRSLRLLVDQLDERDRIAIVVYGTNARAVLPSTSATERGRIISAIDGLRGEGSTNAEAGIRMAYAIAVANKAEGSINRVILCSDGVANVGRTGAEGILGEISGFAAQGVTLTSLGFGMGNYNDRMMETLADKGDGQYAYIDTIDEARELFVDKLTGTLQVIARDVKIQLEFDESAVARYRLLGYENRKLTAREFEDDRVDAGEVGAGHAVTAIYEVKLKRPSEIEHFGTLRIRYKTEKGGQSSLMEVQLPGSLIKSDVSLAAPPTRLSLASAMFAEKLRGSYWVRGVSYADVIAQLDGLPDNLRGSAQVRELRQLVLTAQGLDKRPDRFADQVPIAQMDFDRVPVLQ